MGIVEKSWEMQRKLNEKVANMGSGKYGRVLKMATKPEKDEYYRSCLITGLGILLIGGIGFLIWLTFKLTNLN